jgi:2-phosphosulfolactate phosphatase
VAYGIIGGHMPEPEQCPGAFFEWGAAGAESVCGDVACVVVTDVLSFTTAVAVATERGTEVLPCADAVTGQTLADETGASLAVGRHEISSQHPWSLSPASLADPAKPPPARLALPSPNGSAISRAVASAGLPVVAACLRNSTAIVRWLLANGYATASRPIAVIAAGELWRDGTLRPALEDLLSAGLVLHWMAERGVVLSPGAYVAARSVAGLEPAQIAGLVRASASGVELRVAGFGEDVEIAAELDADDGIPVLEDLGRTGGFRRRNP